MSAMPHEHHVLAHVRSAAAEAVAAVERRSFEKDADRFLEVLQRVPNHPPDEVSDADVQTLLGLVDQVVEAIEESDHLGPGFRVGAAGPRESRLREPCRDGRNPSLAPPLPLGGRPGDTEKTLEFSGSPRLCGCFLRVSQPRGPSATGC